MKRASVWAWTACLVLLANTATSGEIGFVEDFALARDREAALKLLIPGSEDYYYYHCLHYQNTEQFDKVDALLEAWIKRYNYTPRVREIQTRQALLTYEQHPEQTLEYIRQQLSLQFNHQREALGEKPNLPTALDQALISRERLQQLALQQYQDLSGFSDTALDWLVAAQLDPDRRRHLLQRLQRPDYPNLPKLVVDDLNYRYSQPFGSMPIHSLLLLNQLDECLRLKPELLNEQNFVNIYLSKLHPNADVDWQYETEEHAAYLDRLWTFVARLSPAHNSLKAHVLYQRLAFDRDRGLYDKNRFLTYIRLPRNVSYIAPQLLDVGDNRRYAADLSADFSGVTLLPPIHNDEPLVREYLHHFFLTEANTKVYEPFINDVYLRHNFAEAKIVNGLGEPEQWYSLLPPEVYQALKDRIDLDFAPTNQRYFAAEEPVRLDLDVKNVRSLIVRVFEINTRNYYREFGREVNTDINLDGLVANDEQTHEYAEPPLRRVRRHFEFATLNKPGVYVIDFIGNGMNSRVVVRKGRLRHLVRTTSAGHVFTVLNDRQQPLDDASIWLGGVEYKADDKGRILIPYSTQPARQAIILTQGNLASLDYFDHHAEAYHLAAGIYVDRESLLKHRQATVVVRPGLYVNGTPVSLQSLEDVRLIITSLDRDGVASSKEVKDFELFEDRESLYEFQTPVRLSQITFTVQAKVQSLSENKKVDLAVNQTFQLNGIDKTEKVEDLHFAQIAGQYVLELRGKTGEVKPDRAVQIVIKHRDFQTPVQVALQTDGDGRLELGTLADVDTVTATGPEGTAHTWTLERDRHTFHQSLHARLGEPIAVPYLGNSPEPQRHELSLLALRGGTFLADHFQALKIEDGLLHITGLPRGDYDLWLKASGHHIRLRVTEGDEQAGYVLGTSRQLEVRGRKPLHISAVETGEKDIRIRLQNTNPLARVHIFATRYEPAFNPFSKLSSVTDTEPYLIPIQQLTSLYMAGRGIGDEYQYIINRRYAQKFPGVMAERPSVLLNPWAIRSTESGNQDAAAGSDFAPTEQPPSDAAAREERLAETAAAQGEFANLDFLANTSAVLTNLVPDEQGVVTVPVDLLGAHQQLHVVAVDSRSTTYRRVSVPERQTQLRDLRLAAGLDPARHFTQQKQVSIVLQDGEFVLPDIVTSRFQSYDTLARVYTLYATLSHDAKLAEFGFVLNWPKLTVAEKKEQYSKYACHELNYFLLRKDPRFFEEVVRPYLANKKDQTFLDHWLLGHDLADFLQPWNYERLNVVERVLLSQRVAADRVHTVRDIRDRFALLAADPERQNILFLTAVQGRALDTDGEAAGLAVAQTEMFFGRVANGNEAKDGAVSFGYLSESAMAGMGGAAGRGGTYAAPAAPAAAAPADPQSLAKELAAADKPMEERLGALSRRSGAVADRFEKKMALGDMMANFDASDMRGMAARLYVQLDKTQEWVENNYYKLPIEAHIADLVGVSGFWRDYVEHDPAQPFYSVHLAEAARNFPEMMFALSVLDLPFEAAEHETEFAEGRMTMKAAGPMIVFHEQIREAGDIVEQTPILVSQNFFRYDDRYRFEENERLDKFVTEEFLVHTVYGSQVAITNPTSSPQKLDVLVQIPVGSLPVLNTQETRSVHIDLQPFSTQTLEYHFYFPAAGRYPHYPVHVAKNEKLLAHVEPFTFTAVEELSRIDRDSWPYISQNGSGEDVLNYLRQHNLHRTDLEKIAFRMGNKEFFLQVIELLAQRHVYHNTLWSYGIKHNAVPAIREYLQHADGFVQLCGARIDSRLLTIDPVARRSYQHIDYQPLVNARAHQLGRRRQIVNERLHQQYHSLLTILSYHRDLDDDALLATTYYLLLQDRVAEALGFFERVNAADLQTRLQYDYFAAYLNLCRADVAAAREITKHYATHPVDRWRNAFVTIDRQLDEITGSDVEVLDPESRSQTQTQLASTAPAFDFKVEAKKVHLDYQNLDRVLVNYYLMDIELLFSRNPFVQQSSSQFSQVRPNLTETFEIRPTGKQFEFPLPAELHNRNVLVEVVAAGQTKSQAYYSNSLSLQLTENYGQLQVTSANPGKPLPAVYVKVYARMQDGGVKFYKDGYTDLRGRFDYSSLNTNELDYVDKFALLILSDDHGAIVREASAPKR